MRRRLDSSLCILLGLFGLALPSALTARPNLEGRVDVHRIEKAYAGLQRRDAECQASWSLCAASLSGGCCPNNYACETSHCYATTAGPTTACGKSGWYNCPLEGGPGACCPVGYVCGRDTCEAPEGVSYSQACPANYYLCPSSLNYGCCQSGLGCGKGFCYTTNPSTFTVSSPVTLTDSRGSTITSYVTSTGVTTPGPGSMRVDGPGAVAKFIPSTVSKLPTVQPSASSGGGGGLTSAQLGGIIGGIIAVLIAIVVAAFFIIRRLRKTAQAVEQSKQGSSADKTSKPAFQAPTVTEIDPIDIDPLEIIPSTRPSRPRGESSSSIDRYPSPARSPQVPSGTSTPPQWPHQYNALPNMDLDGNVIGVRHPSMDSASGGYYDPARYSQNSPGLNRLSFDSQPQSQSGQAPVPGQRWSTSNASEVMGSADGAHGLSELEGLDSMGAPRPSGGAARPPAAHLRRSYDGQQFARHDSFPVAAPLGTVTEFAELHGYYGASDGTIGQTAARPPSGTSPTTR